MIDLMTKLKRTLIVALLFSLVIPAFVQAESQPIHGAFSNVKKIRPALGRSYAIKEDGSLWAWGDNTYGELGNGTRLIHAWSPSKVQLDDVKDVSGGSFFTVAVKNDGTVWTWGMNDVGQLGIGKNARDYILLPQKIELDGVVAVSTAITGSFAIREDGTIWVWGSNFSGILGHPVKDTLFNPVQIPDLKDIVKVISSGFYTFALNREGEVWGWGTVYTSQDQVVQEPYQVEALSEIVDISIRDGWFLALERDGTVWQWDHFVERMEDIEPPQQIRGLPKIKSLPIGDTGLPGAVDIHGNLWTWNNNGWGPRKVEGITGIEELAGERDHWLALTEDQHVYSWGSNNFGQLGINQLIDEVDTPMIVMKPISVFLNGKSVKLPISPLLVSSRTFVPLRGVLEHMNVEVLWDAEQRSVFLRNEDTEIVLKPGSTEANVNGTVVKLEEPSIFVNDRVFVPLRFVSETMGANVDWDDKEVQVRITY